MELWGGQGCLFFYWVDMFVLSSDPRREFCEVETLRFSIGAGIVCF